MDLARFSANRNLPAAHGWRFSDAHWRALRERALATIVAWHARLPDSVGPPEDRIAGGLRLSREVRLKLADELAREGLIVREALGVRLPSHRAELSAADSALWKRIEPLLEKSVLHPPPAAELAVSCQTDPGKMEAALSRMARRGLVVRVSKNRFFLPQGIRQLEELAHAEAQEEGRITAAAFRDRSGIGRNLAIEVLEYFDRIKFTRRVGDTHVLIGRDSHPGGAPGLQIQ